MKLTTKSEYALLAVIYIARKSGDDFVKIDEICRKHEIPRKYLEQLLTVLKRNRYVKTKRGSSGGYKLARLADNISVAEIVRLMDGALAPTESVSSYFYSQTPLEQEKKILSVFRDIRDYIALKLENVKISDLT